MNRLSIEERAKIIGCLVEGEQHPRYLPHDWRGQKDSYQASGRRGRSLQAVSRSARLYAPKQACPGGRDLEVLLREGKERPCGYAGRLWHRRCLDLDGD